MSEEWIGGPMSIVGCVIEMENEEKKKNDSEFPDQNSDGFTRANSKSARANTLLFGSARANPRSV